MTRGEMRRVLYGYLKAKRQIRRLNLEMIEVEALKSSVSIDYSKTRVMTSGRPDKMANLIDRLDQLEEKMVEAKREAVREMELVQSLIALVHDETIREIMTRRFIVGEGWIDVSEAMCMDMRHLMRLQARGIDDIIEMTN